MQASRAKRLAELERSLAATHEQVTERYQKAVRARFSRAELEQIIASVDRRELPGYVLTAEDKAIEQRWHEAVQAEVPEDLRRLFEWQAWAIEWGKAVKSYA